MKDCFEVNRSGIYSITATAKHCGQTENAIRRAIKCGELPAKKRGRQTYIEGEALYRWLTGKPQQTCGGSNATPA